LESLGKLWILKKITGPTWKRFGNFLLPGATLNRSTVSELKQMTIFEVNNYNVLPPKNAC